MNKPVHITRASGKLTGRDAIWQAIRELQVFTLLQLEAHCSEHARLDEVNRHTARTYVNGLEKAGYLSRTGEQRADRKVSWQLIKDIGVDAPRINRNGEYVNQGASREQMWKAMRILKDFTWLDMVNLASTEEVPIEPNTAKDFIGHLHKAEYLAEITPPNNGGGIARYKLMPHMNTGPKPPMVQRIKQVFDPNLNKVVWPKEGN